MLQAVSTTRGRAVVAAAGASRPGPSSSTNSNARQRRRRHPQTLPVLLPAQQAASPPGNAPALGPGPTLLLIPIAPQQLQQQTAGSVEAAPATPASDSSDSSKPAWAQAVDRRVAALPSTSARSARWRGRAAPSSPRRPATAVATAAAAATTTAAAAGFEAGRLLQTTSSLDRFLQGGEISAEGEQQLCLAYQRYMQLQAVMAQPHQALQHMQQAADRQQQQPGAAAAATVPGDADLQALLQDPAGIQQEGLLAREVLLQMYEPLLLNRVKRAQGQQKHIDSRELLTAARQGLLRAAARFDPQRVTAGRDRLYALAERYISMALRDVLSEYQTAAVHVPVRVRELGAKLSRVKQQMQQQQNGREPSVEALAAAAGVSVQQAQRALAATGRALQAMSLNVSASQDKEDRGKAGAGADLQQMDVSREEDSQELSGTVGAGGLAAARSGLQEELDAAAEQAAVADLLQGLMNRLSPDDRHLLQLKLEGGNMSQAARELGWSRQWAAVAVDKVVQKLRQDMQQHAEQDADVAALLKSC